MVEMASEIRKAIKEVSGKRAVMEEAISLVVRDGERKIVDLIAREILNGINSGIGVYKAELKILKEVSHENGLLIKSESDFVQAGVFTSAPGFDALLSSDEGKMARSFLKDDLELTKERFVGSCSDAAQIIELTDRGKAVLTALRIPLSKP